MRRATSRFGGRLEPFFHLRLVLHEGRGDLLTVTSAETVAPHARLRNDRGGLDTAARACDAVARLFESGDPNPAVFHLLANELALLDAEPGSRRPRQPARLPDQVAASPPGLTPHLDACASCGEREHLVAFSGAAGGVVCSACEASAFPLDGDAHAFLVAALARPLAEVPEAEPRALRQAERAIGETAEHHGHVRWRPAVAA